MSKSSDIRDWLREQGRDVPEAGRLKSADIAAYEAAHEGEADTSYPDLPGEADSDSAATQETPPRPTRASGRTAASGWLGRGRKPKARKAGGQRQRERRTFPRVPVNRLIEHAWADMAWAAKGLPPMARLLQAQAPIAGVVFEDIVKDTILDRALQPAARLEDKADKAYGMLMPPLYVMAVMSTAPGPGEDPSLAHKSAFIGLRHSLLVMSRIGGPNLAELEQRAADDASREADVDRFIRFLFDMPEPVIPEDEAERAREQADILYASATYGAGEAPV